LGSKAGFEHPEAKIPAEQISKAMLPKFENEDFS
jgi:hypothetical protein